MSATAISPSVPPRRCLVGRRRRDDRPCAARTAPPESARPAWILGNLLASIAFYGVYLTLLVLAQPRQAQTRRSDGSSGKASCAASSSFGVISAAAWDSFVLVRYPELRNEGSAGLGGYVATAVVTLAVASILVAYGWLAQTRVCARARHTIVARRYGLVAGLFAGLLFVAASLASAPKVLIVVGAASCAAMAGHLASRVTGEARTGLVAGAWAGVITGLSAFVVAGVILVTSHATNSPTMIADFHASTFHDLRSFSLAGTFGLDGEPPLIGALVPLVLIPVLCVALATFGATRGDRHIAWNGPKAPPAAA